MWITGQCQTPVHHKINSKSTEIYMTFMLQQSLARSVKERKVKSGSGGESAE